MRIVHSGGFMKLGWQGWVYETREDSTHLAESNLAEKQADRNGKDIRPEILIREIPDSP